MYDLDINKKYYISIDNWSQFFLQRSFTLQHMTNIIKDLDLEKEVSLQIDEDKDDDENLWIQRTFYFDYCLKNWKKGQSDIITSVGQITPNKMMDKIIDSCGKNNCKPIRIEFLGGEQSAYETD
jgi:hypothetical protein